MTMSDINEFQYISSHSEESLNIKNDGSNDSLLVEITDHDMLCPDYLNDSKINDWVDMMSNSNSSGHEDILELDNIALTEPEQSNVISVIPDYVPDDNLLIIKVPEGMENDTLLNHMMDIDVNNSILNKIDEAINGFDGVFLAKVDNETVNSPQGSGPFLRRSPLQKVQQIISYPSVKNKPNKIVEAKPCKRKQIFIFPREDYIEFYSDDEDENNNTPNVIEKSKEQAKVNPPSKKNRIEENIKIGKEGNMTICKLNLKKSTHKDPSKMENCPVCNKEFKRLNLHKCKVLVAAEPNNPIKRLKPSEVPLPLKCSICKEFFVSQELIQKHQQEMHSHLVCKVCKLVSKNQQAMKLHSFKCGVDINPIKSALRNSTNKK